MHRLFRGFAVAATMLLGLGACSSDAGTGTAASRTLDVVLADDWATAPPVLDAIRDFEREHPHVVVHIEGVPFSQIPDVVRSSIDSGQPIDAAHWHAFAAGAQGLAENLDDLWDAHLAAEDYLPGAIEDVTWADHRYGVPLDVNAMVLLVNRTLLREAGFDEDVRKFGDIAVAARKVTATGQDRRGIALPLSSWTTYGWIRANGGELVDVDEDGDARVTLDAPEVVAALEFLGGLVRDGVAYPPVTRNVENDAFALFRSGSTALHATGSWDIAALDHDAPEWELATSQLPGGTEGTTAGSALGGSSLFVPLGSDDRDLAFAFMRHLAGDTYALRLAKEEGRLPPRLDLLDDPFFDSPTYRTVVEQLKTAHPAKLIAFPEADEAFSRAIERILTGEATAAAALHEAQEVANAAAMRASGS